MHSFDLDMYDAIHVFAGIRLKLLGPFPSEQLDCEKHNHTQNAKCNGIKCSKGCAVRYPPENGAYDPGLKL